MSRKKKTRIIHIVARKWFDGLNGNTYFSAIIYVNGDLVHTIEFEYGYNDHYMTVASNWLFKNGYLPGKTEHGSLWQPLRQYCDEYNIKLNHSSCYVKLKRDM